MSVRFINLFTVPVGRDERFLELWTRVNRYMAAKPGYRNHRLHRAMSDEAPYRFVNYVEWESDEAWAAAHDEGFRELVGDPGWAEFTTTPALYDIVHEGSAGAPARAS
ncbi:MAG TPA: antibiotic biosynthesis monooxygenase family protein [Jatrophihabitans sp.]|jgi:heme-degrading monooxygenase HmoA|nr:antibiotic biosynthesis monooxygenase family protein [Jatrophihabitans sp.]